MPIDRDRPQDDAEKAAAYRARLIAKGLSKAEANELTVAWILARYAVREIATEEPREPWESG